MKRSVIIIGAGIAGLGAASDLARNGFAVIVLEAKRRVGGRIYTLQHEDCPVELGAEFIHGRSKPFIALIKQAGLSTCKLPVRQQIFQDGQFNRLNLLEKVGEVIDRISLREKDRSFNSFLVREDVSPETRRLSRSFVEGFNAADGNRISTHSLLKAQQASEKMDGEWQGRINEGFSALTRTLEDNAIAHGARFVRRAKVQMVRWKSGSVEVSWRTNNRTHTAKASVALSTVSLGVLKAGTICFEPTLPGKEAAIRKIEFGNIVKLIFIFRTRAWPASLEILQSLDEPIPTWWSNSRGTALTGWAGGPGADLLCCLTRTELEALGLQILGRILSQRPATLRKKLVAVHTHRWEKDPEILGAYSYIPVDGLDLPRILAAPVANTIFFAGEATATDAQMGMVFNAYNSGLRAAREIRGLK